MRRGFQAVVAVATSGIALLVGCTPVPGPSGPPPTTTSTTLPVSATPQILSFTATRSVGPAPLTAALQWSLSGPVGAILTCSLDVGDNGTTEFVVNPCNNSSLRSVTVAAPGTQTVRLRVTDGVTPVQTTLVLNALAAPTDQYSITVRFSGTPTATQQAAFNAAANRWSQVIRAGLTDIALNVAADECVSGAPAFAGTVDDVVIDAIVVPIDGPGAVLGQAGPCLIRTAGGLTAYGVMQFDSADVADLETSGQLQTVILHEMGHVLGIGTLWGSLLAGSGTGFPSFLGPVARGAWNAIGGDGTSVPVEGGGGPGTVDSHWSESVFGNELMTGFLSPASNPLSAITVGSLADLGYGVDLAAADPYGVPAIRTPVTAERLNTIMLRPVRSV